MANANRCGYFAAGDILFRKIITIDWSKGFDKEAKHQYGLEMIEKLSEIGPTAEVTSGSPFFETRQLSPIFVKMKNSDMSVEDYLQEQHKRLPNIFTVPGLADMILLQNIGEKEIRVVNKFVVFADMFYNPKNGFGNSQACSYAVYKLLQNLGKLYIIQDNREFMHFYQHEMRVETI